MSKASSNTRAELSRFTEKAIKFQTELKGSSNFENEYNSSRQQKQLIKDTFASILSNKVGNTSEQQIFVNKHHRKDRKKSLCNLKDELYFGINQQFSHFLNSTPIASDCKLKWESKQFESLGFQSCQNGSALKQIEQLRMIMQDLKQEQIIERKNVERLTQAVLSQQQSSGISDLSQQIASIKAQLNQFNLIFLQSQTQKVKILQNQTIFEEQLLTTNQKLNEIGSQIVKLNEEEMKLKEEAIPELMELVTEKSNEMQKTVKSLQILIKELKDGKTETQLREEEVWKESIEAKFQQLVNQIKKIEQEIPQTNLIEQSLAQFQQITHSRFEEVLHKFQYSQSQLNFSITAVKEQLVEAFSEKDSQVKDKMNQDVESMGLESSWVMKNSSISQLVQYEPMSCSILSDLTSNAFVFQKKDLP